MPSKLLLCLLQKLSCLVDSKNISKKSSGPTTVNEVNNVQISQINADGSSNANQINTGGGNSAYAWETLTGNAQGFDVEVISNGWSAAEGEGTVAQADQLDHQQGSGGQNESSAGNSERYKLLKPVSVVV